MRDDSSTKNKWSMPFISAMMLHLQQIFGIIQYGNALAVDGWELPIEADGRLFLTQVRQAMQAARLLVIDKDDGSEANKWNLFVYDTAKGVWHKEDNTRACEFCSCGGELYYIDQADGFIKTIFGSGVLETRKVEWMAETGIIGTNTPDKKYISKMNIRLSLDLDARIAVYIQYDSLDKWDFLFRIDGTSNRSFTIPIRPKRCDHLRLRLEGEGNAKVYSISKTIENGSDF